MVTVVEVVVPELLEPLPLDPELVEPELVLPEFVEPESVVVVLLEPEFEFELELEELLFEEELLDAELVPVELLVAVLCEPEALVDEPELPADDELLADGLGELDDEEPLAVVLSVRLVLVLPEMAIDPAGFAVAALRPYLYEAASTPSDATAKMFLVVLLTRQTPLRELALQGCRHDAGSFQHYGSKG